MKKILFLDIDGVLNCTDDFVAMSRKSAHCLGQDKIERLHEILRLTDAKVVLSSTWRRYPQSIAFLKRKKVRFIDMTPTDIRGPHLGSYVERGREIDAWLKGHPEVERYCILDDDSDMLLEQMPFFVQTDFRKGGLQQEHVDKVVELLNKGE